MTIRDLASCFVSLPDDRGVARFQPAFPRVREWRIPAPGVDTGDAHAARAQIKRRLTPHAAAGGEILLRADATASPGIDEHDIERLQLVTDAPELRLDLVCGHDVTIRQMLKVELDPWTKKPLERHLV